MKREEAISKGVQLADIKHSMKRRKSQHDYGRFGSYMLTMVTKGRLPLFGTLHYETFSEDQPESAPFVSLSPLGKAILQDELQKISQFYPMIEVQKACIMPDHIHIIIHVKRNMPKGSHIGKVIGGFKSGCSKAWWRLQDEGIMPTNKEPRTDVRGTVPCTSVQGSLPQSARPPLFEPGYNDKILMREGQLERWIHYLDDNPRRLAVKRSHPDFFTIRREEPLLGKQVQMVGNRFLLDIPMKAAIVVHRAYTDSEYARLAKEWLALGEAGGVLVSAAIAPREKLVMREAMNRGYSIILLRENGFPPIYKPSGESFDACASGQLLQIAPWEYHTEHKTISREQCLQLNHLAEQIAES